MEYYKYFRLIDKEDCRHCAQAISDQQIHMGPYTQVCGVNDQKEGRFLLDEPLDESFRNRLKREKQTYMIGCASMELNNQYMWNRFANNERGLCIAFTCCNSGITAAQVEYVDGLPKMSKQDFEALYIEDQVRFALLHKRKRYGNEEYEKENEVRFLKKVNANQHEAYLSISITAIYLGRNMPNNEVRNWQSIAQIHSVDVFQISKDNCNTNLFK